MRFLLSLAAIAAIAATLFFNFSGATTHAQALQASDAGAFVYVSPAPNASTASAATTIAVRGSEAVAPGSLDPHLFSVVGSASGSHQGEVVVARDGQTVIFKPSAAFTPGETVTVAVGAGLRTSSGATLPAAQWQFTVSPKPYPYSYNTEEMLKLEAQPSVSSSSERAQPVALSAGKALSITAVLKSPHYVTAPDWPAQLIITRTAAALGEGLIFWSPYSLVNASQLPHLAIFDDNANLVYKQSATQLLLDFKRQPNGLLSYFDIATHAFYVLDNTYNRVDTWTAGNGLVTDPHDLQVLPNGHALLMIYDFQPADLSSVGGLTNTTVIDLVIQELDQDKNVVFEWNSRDHIAFTDTYIPLNTAQVDYVHGNALQLDTDGNLMLSSRHLSEITKIDRSTGAIIWRMGGKNNQFTFIGDQELPGVGPFSFQHDIRRLDNGNITLYDNGNQFMTAGIRGSRGVEYALDETAKTATLVREFRLTPDVRSDYMGNLQRLPNGNSLIGWGGGTLSAPLARPSEAITEFTPEGEAALDINVDIPYVSYRAYRFPWQGFPTTPPKLVAITTTTPISLYYSWNGATEVVSYTVSGGPSPSTLTPFAAQPKTGFEDSTALDAAAAGDCFFQVLPHQKENRPSLASNVVYVGDAACASAVTVQPAGASGLSVPIPTARGVSTVTLDIAAGTVTSATIFAVAPSTAITQPPAGFALAGLSFDLSTSLDDELSGMSSQVTPFAKPVQVTIAYGAAQLGHVAVLTLARWDPTTQSWSSDGISLATNDTGNQQFTAQVNRPGVYALVYPRSASNRAPAATIDLAVAPVPEPNTPDAAIPPVVIDVVANDTDADNDPLTIIAVSQPQHGTAVIADNKVVYTPRSDYAGFDQFTYVVADGHGEQATGTVYVSTAVNRAFLPLLKLNAQ